MKRNQPRVKSSCDACQNAKVRCSKDKPTCTRCNKNAQLCVYSVSRRLGRPRRQSNTSSMNQRGSSPNSSSNIINDNGLRSPASDFEWMSMDTFITEANAHEHNVGNMMLADCRMSESDISDNLSGTAYLDGLMTDFLLQCYDSEFSPHLPLSSTSDPQLMLKDNDQVEPTTTMSHGASHNQLLVSVLKHFRILLCHYDIGPICGHANQTVSLLFLVLNIRSLPAQGKYHNREQSNTS